MGSEQENQACTSTGNLNEVGLTPPKTLTSGATTFWKHHVLGQRDCFVIYKNGSVNAARAVWCIWNNPIRWKFLLWKECLFYRVKWWLQLEKKPQKFLCFLAGEQCFLFICFIHNLMAVRRLVTSPHIWASRKHRITISRSILDSTRTLNFTGSKDLSCSYHDFYSSPYSLLSFTPRKTWALALRWFYPISV